MSHCLGKNGYLRERERERERDVKNLTSVFFKLVMDRCPSNILTHIRICRKCCNTLFAANPCLNINEAFKRR